MAWTEQVSGSRRIERKAGLLVLPRPADGLQRGQASAGKREQTGPAEKERVASEPQSEQLARCQSPLCQKGKKQSHMSRLPDHEVGES